jgi:DUF4097 and DUF4098 domain-containing protein YvlB
MRKVLVAAVIIVMLVSVCACIGLVLFNFRTMNGTSTIQSIVDQVRGGAPDAFSAETTEAQTFSVSGAAFVDADTPFGNVTITGGTGSQVSVTAQKTTYGDSQSQADANLQNLKVSMTQDGSRVTLRVEDPLADARIQLGQASQVDFTVQVPTETTVSVHTRSGDVSLSGTQGKADLFSDFGTVEVHDVKGGVALHSSSGQVTASGIQLLPSGFGDLSLYSEFGEVSLQDVSLEHVVAHSGSGSVSASNVASTHEIDLSTSYGGITVQGARAVSFKASTNSGEVSLNQVEIKNDLNAHSDFGAIKLAQVNAASYDLSCQSGGISADSAHGTFKATTGFGDIDVSGGSGVNLTMETNSGQIHYSGSLGAGPHSLRSAFGEISLALPATSTLQLDLKTDFGEITSAFQVTTSGTLDPKHLTGSVNGGGATLTAVTQSGDITLEILKP